jgi:hypothetical protein
MLRRAEQGQARRSTPNIPNFARGETWREVRGGYFSRKIAPSSAIVTAASALKAAAIRATVSTKAVALG